MRETSKAKEAWLDYLAMGPERSLERLLTTYQTAPKAHPTNRLETVKLWSRAFGWQERLAEIAAKEQAAIEAKGIADRQYRIDGYNRDYQRLEQVIRERAEDAEMADVPGGTTGLLVHTIKVVGVGQNAQRVDEYTVDTALLREKREHAKQAAQELGQWTEKADVSSGGKPLTFTIAIDRADSAEES